MSSAIRNFFQGRALTVLVCIGLILIFAVLLLERLPWLALQGDGVYGWQSASTLKFAMNWFHEGAAHVRFLMLELPYSIETRAIIERQPYFSYPSGVVFPIYWLSKALGKPPQVELVQSYGIFLHGLSALILAGIANSLLRSFAAPFRCFAAFASGFSYLLLPIAGYFHQFVYFSETAVIPFYLGIFLFELWLDDEYTQNKKWIKRAQIVLIFCGVFTEWLAVFAVAFLFLKRFLKQQEVFSLIFPCVLPLIIYLLQALSMGGMGILTERFLISTGIQATSGSEARIGIEEFFRIISSRTIRYFGLNVGMFFFWVVPVMLATSFIVAWTTKSEKMDTDVRDSFFLLFGLALVPWIQSIVLSRHTVIHDFSVLRLLPPLLGVICILPFFILGWIESKVPPGELTRFFSWFTLLLGIGWFGYICQYSFKEHSGLAKLVELQEKSAPNLSAAKFVGRQARFEDIVVSPRYFWPLNPAQALWRSRKVVYRWTEWDELKRKPRYQVQIVPNAHLFLLLPASCATNKKLNAATVEMEMILSEEFAVIRHPLKDLTPKIEKTLKDITQECAK